MTSCAAAAMGPAVRWAVVLLAALRPGEASTPEPDLLWQPQIGPRLVNVLQQLQSEERSVTNLPFFMAERRKKGKKLTLRITCLTLSYSSEGSPALAVFRPHYL